MSRLDWQRARERDTIRAGKAAPAVRVPAWRLKPPTEAQLRTLNSLNRLLWGPHDFRPPRGFTRGQASDLIDAWNRTRDRAQVPAS